MNYSPRNYYVWDGWCMPVGEVVHMYHLQIKRPDSAGTDEGQAMLGHALSRDLVDWQECPPALAPQQGNTDDDLQPWTGCALWHEGRGYLYYTMRGSANRAMQQKIGLATSSDGYAWQRHGGNPVIVPDARWYSTVERPTPGVVDCRDLIVIPDPTGGWLGFYATRQQTGEELADTAVIACAHSDDLLHWEQRPPAFVPRKYACIEVPDVFELDGRWYLTCLAGHWYGNRGVFSDPNVTTGTIYAVAQRPQGPYVELADNVLLGGRFSAPFSCRTVRFEGRLHLLYTDRERIGRTDAGETTVGTIATPKLLAVRGDRLVTTYCDRIETHVSDELIGPGRPPRLEKTEWGQIWSQMPTARWQWGSRVTASARSGWGVAMFDCPAESFIYEADVTLQSGVAAGLAIRIGGRMSGMVAAVDAQQQCVMLADLPVFDNVDRRQTPVPLGRPMHLRVVGRLEHLEVYLDDELRVAMPRYAGIGGKVGLFVDRGLAHFDNLRLRTLRVSQPR